MPTGLLTRSQYTTNPPEQVSVDSELEVRGFYLRSFIAGDGVTPIQGNSSDGQEGPYYSIGASLNADGDLVVAAQEIQATTLSRPTSGYVEQLWVDGAYVTTLLPNTNVVSGWQIPTVYGDPIAYDEIAYYNRAKTLVPPPGWYDIMIQEIRRLAGNFDYMAVDVNGIGQASFPPIVASEPIVLMENDPRVGDWYNVLSYGAAGNGVHDDTTAVNLAIAAALAGGGGVYIPLGTFPVNNVSFTTVPIMFAPGNSILKRTGGTITIGKSITADPSQHFIATDGQISFVGDLSIPEIYTEWWGAVADGSTDSTAAIQSAFTASEGRPIRLMKGTYVVTSGLTYLLPGTNPALPGLQLIGEGMYDTFFDNQVANGTMLSLSSSIAFQFAFGTKLSGFSIIATGTPPVNSNGISLRSQWFITVDSVRVHGLTGKAISGQTDQDSDSNSYVKISHCYLTNNGHGIYMANTTFVGWNHVYITLNHIQFNTGYGIACLGGESIYIETNGISDNDIGLYINNGVLGDGITPGSNGPRNIRFYGNEFQSNITYHVWANAGQTIIDENNNYKSDAIGHVAFRPLVGVLIAPNVFPVVNDGVVQNAIFRTDIVRVTDPGVPFTHTAYEMGSANANNVLIENPNFIQFPSPSIKYVDDGTNTSILEENGWIRGINKFKTTTVSAPATYTPDTLLATFHRIVVDTDLGANTLLVESPTSGLSAGRELEIEVVNSLGAIITISWGADYAFPSGTTYFVGVGERLAVAFRSDGGAWVPMGLPYTRGRPYTGMGNSTLGTINAQIVTTFTITVNGAEVGNAATASPDGDPGAGLVWCARVSSANTVTVSVANPTAGNIVTTNRTWQAVVQAL